MGPMLGPHAHTNRARETRVAVPWLPARRDWRPGEGQRLTPDTPHNGRGPPPPGQPPTIPAARSPPQGIQAKGTVLGPHACTPAPKAPGQRTPTARSEDGRLGGGRTPELRRPSQRRRAAPPETPSRHIHRAQRRLPRAHAVEPNAGSPRPHQPRPANTGRGTLAARHDGQASGGGKARDTRRPSQLWKATPSGTASHQPCGTQPFAGHASQRDNAGPPRPHIRAHSTWVADPDSLPRGRSAGGGRAPELRCPPPQRRTAPPMGTPSSRHPNSAQQRLARAHAVGQVLGPDIHTNRARETRVAEPWLPAPRDGRLGEGQRLTSGAPHNGGRPPPPGTATHHPRGTQPPARHESQRDDAGPQRPHTRAHSTWVADPDVPP